MKRILKGIVPLLMAVGIIVSIGWYLFVYDREFTRDFLISQARFFDGRGNTDFAAQLYDLAYDYTGKDDDVAIELASQYRAAGNYTKAEYTLTNAIADSPSVDLYSALCKTYVEQDKLLDAVNMLNSISDPDLKAQMDALRPTAPASDPVTGYYTKYIGVELSSNNGRICYTTDGNYPSTADSVYQEPIVLGGGETSIYAIAIDKNGLVSPLSILGYTVGGVIEEAKFADPVMEQTLREILGAADGEIIMTDQLWTITELTIPENVQVLEDLKLLPYLKKLTINQKRLDSLSALVYLTELEELNLDQCRFPVEDLKLVASLPLLQRLSLSGCGLSTIADLAGAQSLNYLDLSNNTLRNLEAISGTGLTELYLQHNAVTDLSVIGSLAQLEKLDVSFNSITNLLPLASCPQLAWVNAGNNLIADVKGIESFPALTHLYLDQNQLSDVTVLGKCTGLIELNISSNKLYDISTLGALTELTYLNFSYNTISTLPAWPDGSKLSILDGSYNMIVSIHPLKNLEELTYVYLDYNQIFSVDPIANCYRLVMVNVYGNRITDVSALTEHNIIVNYDPTTD